MPAIGTVTLRVPLSRIMPSSTVEDYLKHIYIEQQRRGGELVPMGLLASALGVTPGTATSMIKALADSALVDYEPRVGVRLSQRGRNLALHVLRRHRLIELFLVEVLHFDWSEVHAEAEVLEHAVSDKVLDAIDTLLGHPAVDPHGDPIPDRRGQYPLPPSVTLADCQPPGRYRIARITDQDPDFLRFLDRQGLRPGTEIQVLDREAHAEAIDLQLAESRITVTLGTAAAAKLRVEPLDQD